MLQQDTAIDLSAAIWRLEEIQSFFRLPSEKAAYSFVNSYEFPRPLMGRSRNRRWVAEEVRAWVESAALKQRDTRPVLSPDALPIDIKRKHRGVA
jgi:predicted DNA-binding transcriptional regulator AlpA